MKRSAWLVLAASTLSASALAQDADPKLTAGGQRIFGQSCGVCHTLPTITSRRYGPALSKESLGGVDEALQTVISEGTAHMPGFKYTYDASQIRSVVAYLKTVPVPPPDPVPKAQTGAERRDDN